MEFISDFTITKNDDGTVTISGEIPFSVLAEHRAGALAELGKDINVDGFRKGHVPEAVLESHIGEGTLLQNMAERALAQVYPHTVQHFKLDAVGRPQITITKLAADNPLGFTATVAVMPEVTLPDYKAIAKEVNAARTSPTVTDEHVEAQIKEIMKQRLAYERAQNANAAQSGDTHSATDLPTPDTVAATGSTKPEEITDAELPALTDEYVQQLGQPGQFESVDDFKTKLRTHLEQERARVEQSAHRAALTDAIIEKTKMVVPQVVIDAELDQMLAQLEEDLKRNQLTLQSYLSHAGKTEADLRQEWHDTAKKRAQVQLVLNEIATQEPVTPDAAAVDEQVQALKSQYTEADENRIRTYVQSVYTNEAVMKLLESQ